MAYKEFTAGQEALAADVNTLYMQQTVARFPTAAARTAAIASPALNQLTMRDDRPGVIEKWNGSAWNEVGNRTFSSGGAVGYTIPPAGASSTVPLAAFTLTVPSLVIVHGIATVTLASGSTIQQVDVRFMQAAGGPAPVLNPGSFMAATPFPAQCTLPIWASFGNQPAGPCTIGARGSSAAGGVTLVLAEIHWTAFIQPL